MLKEEIIEWLNENDSEWAIDIDEQGRIFIDFKSSDAILLFKLTWA